MKQLSLTRRTLAKMLTENTGIALMDSGGVSGRAWQRNQGADFENSSASTLKFATQSYRPECSVGDEDFAELEVSLDTAEHSIYHWLADKLNYDYHMQGMFTRFVRNHCTSYSSDFEDLANFIKHLKKSDDLRQEVDSEQELTENTYNGEDMVSQVFQYTQFLYRDTLYIALMIHGGADVRGGYTSPKFFQAAGDPWYPLAGVGDGTIVCSGREADSEPILPGLDVPASESVNHYWDTEDGGYSFTSSYNGCDTGDFTTLTNATNADLKIDEEGNGYCPLCGGLLTLYFNE